MPLTGSVQDLASALGVRAGVPEGLYADHAGLEAADTLMVDQGCAELLATWLAVVAFFAGGRAAAACS